MSWSWQPSGEGFVGGLVVAIATAFGFNRRLNRVEREQEDLRKEMLPRREFEEHKELIREMNRKVDRIEEKLDKYVFNSRR